MSINIQALLAQLLVGLINGSFYALLSLGLAVIFGMLNIINFTHGAQYMMGAFAAYLVLQYTGIGYWPALIIAPILVGITGVLVERLVFDGRRCVGVQYRQGDRLIEARAKGEVILSAGTYNSSRIGWPPGRIGTGRCWGS